MYITNAGDLTDFCEYATEVGLVAVDTEFIRERTYHPQLCLVQLAAADRIALVDPKAFYNLDALSTLLSNESVMKVFHACDQDLAVLYDALDVEIGPLFDTQIAAAFLGMRLQASYANVVEEFCGVHLAKAEALSDWAARPLTPEQISYAEDDVRYLPQIYTLMMQRLQEQGYLEWVLPEMSGFTAKVKQDIDPRLSYIHLKRSSTLTRRQLAIAREACAWREETAALYDIPRRWVLSDEVIIECCRRIPKSVGDLKSIRGTEKLKGTDAAALLRALRAGTHASTDDIVRTKRHEKPSGESEGILDLMNALVRITSKEVGIAPQVLASKDDLVDLMQGRRDACLNSGWRYDVIGNKLNQLLAGQLALTVRNGHLEVS